MWKRTFLGRQFQAHRTRAIWLLCGAAALAGSVSALRAEERVQFNRDIRPIFSDTCFHCHGPDKNARKAGLRLDLREEALKRTESGETPLTPGKPDQSDVISRIFTRDNDELMPPPETHKKLTAKQKETIRRWVAEGAEYQPHWAYVPLVRPALPKLKDQNWPANPLDAFVLHWLEAKHIKPSREADRRMLLRRLSLDLTGLPPTPEEVDAFVADSSSDAYEKQVDRLLASPHFGERMAVWWLDVARFTDTVGFHGDQNQRIFPYRDYVIQAFNRNKRFDQFTVEQLAGDLLPQPTQEQLVATGFNRLNMVTREGGAQAKEYLAKYGAERVRTVSTAFLGSTMGCCECHDHKFDPFTSRDFYSLQAFFADVKQWGVYADYGYTPNPELKGVNNEYPFYPEIQVENDFMQRQLTAAKKHLHELFAEASATLAGADSRRAGFDRWRQEMRAFLTDHPDGWSVLPVEEPAVEADDPADKPAEQPVDKTKEKPAAKKDDKKTDKVVAKPAAQKKADKAKGNELTIDVKSEVLQVASVRLELTPPEPAKKDMPRKLARETVRLSAAVKMANGKTRPLSFYFADADIKEPRYNSTVEAIGVIDGWLVSEKHATEKQTSVWLLNPPVKLADGETLQLTVHGEGSLPSVRAAISPLAFDLVDDGMKPAEKWQTAFSAAAAAIQAAGAPAASEFQLFLRSTAPDAGWFEKFVKQYKELSECRGGRAWTMVTQAVEPLTVRVLPRGNWQDESGAVVQPATPHFLPQENPADRRLTRLDLAHWICSPQNPVTARNIMNRAWKQFYGNALSSVVDDLGAQGEPPSHPELLDWLAVEFRDSGWDVKHMLKLMVMSRTYRQDSSLRAELTQIDPNNRLLASQNPRRLDAEFVRDNALAIAGLLNLEIGGPSVKPYQPAGYYVNIQFPNRDYVADSDARQWRRGVYMHWQRSFLHPMLANFDAPGREECTANRVVSNTPQQALTLLNDPTFVEAARVFGKRLLEANCPDDAARLDLAFELATLRPIKSKERQSLTRFLQAQRDYYRDHPADAEKLLHVGIAPDAPSLDRTQWAAWTAVGRVVLNLQETITRY